MFDERKPVPTVVAEASGTSAGVAGVVDRIDLACREGGRFAVLVDARTAGGELAGRDRRVLLGRLRSLRAELKDRCVGVVFLAGPTGEGDHGKRVRAAELLLGCPVHATSSLDAARSWLAGRGATLAGGLEP